MSILSEILSNKRKELKRSVAAVSLETMKKAARSLPRKRRALSKALRASRAIAVIAEIKRRSPSKGLLRKDFEPARIAKQYERGGASALSVLTDKKYFGGAPEFIARVKRVTRLPVLRKDFILDEYQVYESRLLGADAILLIARALTPGKMRRLYRIATELGLDTLFEVHDEAELKKVLPLKPEIVGVNNRDLCSFKVSLDVSARLSRRIPKQVLFVSESGIGSAEDLRAVRSFGAHAVLVGESLIREKNPGQALKRLLGGSRGTR